MPGSAWKSCAAARLCERVFEQCGPHGGHDGKIQAGTVQFLSTNELTHKDWEVEDLLARHEKMISATALRLDLPTQRLDRHLPKLSANARGDQKLENFKKWQ